jgi:hypothetical protein
MDGGGGWGRDGNNGAIERSQGTESDLRAGARRRSREGCVEGCVIGGLQVMGASGVANKLSAAQSRNVSAFFPST